MKYFSIAILSFALIFAACGDDSSSVSADNSHDDDSSLSSSGVTPKSSSSSEKTESNSDKAGSNSSKPISSSSNMFAFLSSSSRTPKELPPGKYDCSIYKCVSTKFLNPDVEYGELLDERDNQVYRTVQMGEQIWMAQNLNYADSMNTPSLIGKSWCYDNDESNCDRYGRLYLWEAATDSVKLAAENDNPDACHLYDKCDLQGICPNGWHLPSVEEFEYLATFANEIGIFMASGAWSDDYFGIRPDHPNYTDPYGISILPAGAKVKSEEFFKMGTNAYFWSRTIQRSGEYRSVYDLEVSLSYNKDVNVEYLSTRFAFSIRCVKDAE